MTAKKESASDTVKACPAKGLRGTVTVPGDKSISHRAVMIGAIAEGATVVEGFLEGADNLSTIGAFRAMGIVIERAGALLKVHGKGLFGLKEPEDVIDAGNSGTTARLITGILSAQPFFSVITGDESLRTRPMRRVVAPLIEMGAAISGRKGGSLLPLAVNGGRLKGIGFSMPVASAQVKSCLLLAGLYAEGRTTVTEPDKSRDHTERMLRLFGADIKDDGLSVTIKQAKAIKGCEVRVPGDISSAAFFMVGAMITDNSELLIKNVGVNPTRRGVIEILRGMGGGLELLNERDISGEPVADILVRTSSLKGIDISRKELLLAIDEFPVISVAAAFADGRTTVRGAGELRVKESDRIAAMAGALKRLGVGCVELKDGIVIEGMGRGRVTSCVIESRKDHRIAMAAAVAALRSKAGITITGAGSTDVSFPGFFGLLEGVKA
ncbi:MAG: 3-phosphoshikimate 1-carboxyvinyltransferase [Deltaproteobacteria bacterium]|nr:3-phosphoshikimate 1-carboxyvinyltransferase [Deltaproteobacteria bacterium]